MNHKGLISAFLVALLIAVSCSTESVPVYQLITSAEPSEAGSVTPATAEANNGETLQITASSNDHWVFDRWSGDHSGNDNPASVMMSSDKSVTALFIKKDYPLTVTVVGEGSVVERVIQQKSTDYPHGTIVELTANPAEGWEFVGWAGDTDSNNNIIELTIVTETNITVSFQEYTETAFPGQTGELVELTVGGVTIEVEKINNKYVFQGDILINPDDYAELDPNKAISKTGIDIRTWENNIVPYYIGSGVTNDLRQRIFEGIDMITENTNITFKLYNSNIDYFYLVFIKVNEGVWASGLGRNRIFKKHEIGLPEGVAVGTVMHEIMHILGFAHEQSRYNRDEFVNIHVENIREKKINQFNKENWYKPNTPYDTLSVMHYSSYAFVAPNASGPTITDLDGNTFKSQRDELRESDISKINELYPIFWITNPITGRTWMDRNLGASRAARSSTDSLAYGDLYQWGRAADGHEKRNSGTTYILSNTNQPGHGDFILTYARMFFDWRGNWRSPQNDNLWQEVNGVNNPCPYGYRLPTEAEWEAERQSWTYKHRLGAFNSIKLPVTGYRSQQGWIVGVDGGYYWSSTVSGSYSKGLIFGGGVDFISESWRGYGYSVRCIKD